MQNGKNMKKKKLINLSFHHMIEYKFLWEQYDVYVQSVNEYLLFLSYCNCTVQLPYLLIVVPQFINQKFISTIDFHLMLQNFGMICHWKFNCSQPCMFQKGP